MSISNALKGVILYQNMFSLNKNVFSGIILYRMHMYEGCSGSSWNSVIKCSNIYISFSFFEILQVDFNELTSRS